MIQIIITIVFSVIYAGFHMNTFPFHLEIYSNFLLFKMQHFKHNPSNPLLGNSAFKAPQKGDTGSQN